MLADANLSEAEITRAVRTLRAHPDMRLRDLRDDTVITTTSRRIIAPKSVTQQAYVHAIRQFDIDYRAGRGLDRSEMASLGQCNWVRHGINMIITGATGGGKTWLGCALGNQACRQGLTVTFQRLPLLLEELAISHGDGSFCKRLSALAKVDLLILDDFGIAVLNAVGRNDLLEVIEQRTGNRSTLITSQLPVDRWHDYLSGGNPTMADAILDRLVSGAHRMELKGESMRRLRGRSASLGT